MKPIVFVALIILPRCQTVDQNETKPKDQLSELSLTAKFGPSSGNTRDKSLADQLWNNFVTVLNKTYDTITEAEMRKANFLDNDKKLKEIGSVVGYKLTLNVLSDLSSEEYASKLVPFNKIKNKKLAATATSYIPPANYDCLPKAVDWRKRGAISEVNYDTCLGCPAITVAGAIEGQNVRKTGNLTKLSPYNLINCTTVNDVITSNSASRLEMFFDDIKNSQAAISKEEEEEGCRFDSGTDVHVTGFVAIPNNDEKALAVAVATEGPIAATMMADLYTFQLYSGGVYFDPECKNDTVYGKVPVLIAGYGQEDDGTKYWLAKNSFGPDWGMNGYIKIAKDRNNHCGIASSPFFPLI